MIDLHKSRRHWHEWITQQHNQSAVKSARLAIFFKDFSHWVMYSQIGLQVAGYTTARYLRSLGIDAKGYAVRHNIDIYRVIQKSYIQGRPLTHVVISAPFLSLHDLKSLIKRFDQTKFVILSHSNVGFLQADTDGVKLLRQYARLSHRVDNLNIGGNCKAFVDWFSISYDEDNVLLLPNLYLTDKVKSKQWSPALSPVLKVGALGAIRPEKNQMTAVGAVIEMHSRLQVPTEVHMNSGGEGFNNMTMSAIDAMVADVPRLRLIKHHWDTWDKFIKLVEGMDLLIQESYTESFNMIVADGISRGVPSVVSPVITWAPQEWVANPDNATEVAQKGVEVIIQPQGTRGADALLAHDSASVIYWLDFIRK